MWIIDNTQAVSYRALQTIHQNVKNLGWKLPAWSYFTSFDPKTSIWDFYLLTEQRACLHILILEWIDAIRTSCIPKCARYSLYASMRCCTSWIYAATKQNFACLCFWYKEIRTVSETVLKKVVIVQRGHLQTVSGFVCLSLMDRVRGQRLNCFPLI